MLLRGVEWMLAPLVELVLQPETLLVRLDGADRLHDGVDPSSRLELPELARRDRAFTGVVVRESRVPPDASVQIPRQSQAALIGTGFLRGPIEVHEIRSRDHAHGSFALTSVHVRRAIRLVLRFARSAARQA